MRPAQSVVEHQGRRLGPTSALPGTERGARRVVNGRSPGRLELAQSIPGITHVGIGPRLWGIANAHTQVPVVLPDFQPLSQRTEVYDTAGNTIAVFERENSQPIAFQQIPEGVVESLLAVEDAEYFHHHGVNLRGFVRALLSNFASSAPTQGASTITQQVVKNEYLAGLPRDGRYKALQAHYALMLERKLSKQQILERYFAPVLDIPTYAAPAPNRWSDEQRRNIEAAIADSQAAFFSAAEPYPIWTWPHGAYWAVVLAVAAVLASTLVFASR